MGVKSLQSLQSFLQLCKDVQTCTHEVHHPVFGYDKTKYLSFKNQSPANKGGILCCALKIVKMN